MWWSKLLSFFSNITRPEVDKLKENLVSSPSKSLNLVMEVFGKLSIWEKFELTNFVLDAVADRCPRESLEFLKVAYTYFKNYFNGNGYGKHDSYLGFSENFLKRLIEKIADFILLLEDKGSLEFLKEAWLVTQKRVYLIHWLAWSGSNVDLEKVDILPEKLKENFRVLHELLGKDKDLGKSVKRISYKEKIDTDLQKFVNFDEFKNLPLEVLKHLAVVEGDEAAAWLYFSKTLDSIPLQKVFLSFVEIYFEQIRWERGIDKFKFEQVGSTVSVEKGVIEILLRYWHRLSDRQRIKVIRVMKDPEILSSEDFPLQKALYDKKENITWLGRIEMLDDDDIPLIYLKGVVLAKVREWDRALVEFDAIEGREALFEESKTDYFWAAKYWKGLCYEMLGKVEVARDFYEELVEIGSISAALRLLAMCSCEIFVKDGFLSFRRLKDYMGDSFIKVTEILREWVELYNSTSRILGAEFSKEEIFSSMIVQAMWLNVFERIYLKRREHLEFIGKVENIAGQIAFLLAEALLGEDLDFDKVITDSKICSEVVWILARFDEDLHTLPIPDNIKRVVSYAFERLLVHFLVYIIENDREDLRGVILENLRFFVKKVMFLERDVLKELSYSKVIEFVNTFSKFICSVDEELGEGFWNIVSLKYSPLLGDRLRDFKSPEIRWVVVLDKPEFGIEKGFLVLSKDGKVEAFENAWEFLKEIVDSFSGTVFAYGLSKEKLLELFELLGNLEANFKMAVVEENAEFEKALEKSFDGVKDFNLPIAVHSLLVEVLENYEVDALLYERIDSFLERAFKKGGSFFDVFRYARGEIDWLLLDEAIRLGYVLEADKVVKWFKEFKNVLLYKNESRYIFRAQLLKIGKQGDVELLSPKLSELSFGFLKLSYDGIILSDGKVYICRLRGDSLSFEKDSKFLYLNEDGMKAVYEFLRSTTEECRGNCSKIGGSALVMHQPVDFLLDSAVCVVSDYLKSRDDLLRNVLDMSKVLSGVVMLSQEPIFKCLEYGISCVERDNYKIDTNTVVWFKFSEFPTLAERIYDVGHGFSSSVKPKILLKILNNSGEGDLKTDVEDFSEKLFVLLSAAEIGKGWLKEFLSSIAKLHSNLRFIELIEYLRLAFDEGEVYALPYSAARLRVKQRKLKQVGFGSRVKICEIKTLSELKEALRRKVALPVLRISKIDAASLLREAIDKNALGDWVGFFEGFFGIELKNVEVDKKNSLEFDDFTMLKILEKGY